MVRTTSVTDPDVQAYLLSLTPQEEVVVYGNGSEHLRRLTLPLDYTNADLAPLTLYQRLGGNRPGVLYESVDISPVYGRFSLAVVDAPVLLQGKDDTFSLRALNRWGHAILDRLSVGDFSCSQQVRRTAEGFVGSVPCERRPVAEDERLQLNNISQVIRNLLYTFRCHDRLLGLYGAFAYDFVRLFEPLPQRLPPISTQDFRLFLPDLLLFYDHLRERAFLYIYDFGDMTQPATAVVRERLAEMGTPQTTVPDPPLIRIPSKLQSDTGREAYMRAVDEAREQMRLGEFFEVVLSHSFTGQYDRSPLELYRRFREINPSPYQFYVNYSDEALVGASPEMFVRVEDGIVQARPISGTVPRGTDSLSDYTNMMRLLNSEKEKSELDMLIDLARNDISRVCEPGVAVSDYRYVEKYSRVMHTIAHVEGRLSPGLTAFDAFIASLNAGTLTGAPKAAAMAYIEAKEQSRRGYYGGNVGYLTFSGQLDTGIIIRTAHLVRRPHQDGDAYDVIVRAGSTLLYDSEPAAEYAETEAKARALLEALDSTE
jgi:anthranilate synthase